MPDPNSDYINSIDYKKLEFKIKNLISTMDEGESKNSAARRLRYTEIDIESERASGKLAPDELYIPQHIIDTNIRREQSSYVQYVVQSPRAVIMTNQDDPSIENTIIEKDITQKLRFDGWQLSMFSNIDGMQQNGFGVMELVLDMTQRGELAHESIQLGDFGFVSDTKDIQESEMVCRNYYFSKTKLLEMAEPNSDKKFDLKQVSLVVDKDPPASDASTYENKDKSLYKIQKVMFRVAGVVQVGWCCYKTADDWLRAPRPLFIGRKQLTGQIDPNTKLPLSQDLYETKYPYYLFPYLISENNTISQLKGRVYLDQDTQEAASSLLSSFCTAHRRASGLYFSKDVSDPNDDLLLQKNVYFKQGALINSKVTEFQLTPPSPDMLSAVQTLITSNQAETSKVNFAAQNRKDSRKTATEIQAASQEAQSLSTVQVVLFSNSLCALYTTMWQVIQSRVLAGLIQVNPQVAPFYQAKYDIKPAGDVDVIERQQLVQAMMSAWPVMQNTPAAQAFLSDLLSKMFPEYAAKYIQIFQQAQQAQQSAQAQQQQQMMGVAAQMGQGIVKLSEHPEFFSDSGKVHAYPAVQMAAEQIQQVSKAAQGQK